MANYIDPPRKLLYHADRIAELKAGKTSAPVNVEIDLSNRCSLGCEWCHFAYTHTRGPLKGAEKPEGATPGGDLMGTGLAKRIIDEMVAAGVKSVVWSGGGEPTLHPEFDRIIAYAGHRIAQGVYTHGGHITEERAAIMRRWLDWVYVSLDECTAPEYKERKGGDFAKPIQGIKHLLRAPGEATVGVGFLIGRHNLHRIPGMVGLALQELNADYVQFRPIIEHDVREPGKSDPWAGAWVSAAIDYLREYADNPRVIADLNRFRMYRDWTGHGYDTCYWAAMQTVITPNGKMWICLNKREYPDAEIADLSQMSFAEAWQKAGACAVDGNCRVMCRGHVPNITLDQIMTPGKHWRFV